MAARIVLVLVVVLVLDRRGPWLKRVIVANARRGAAFGSYPASLATFFSRLVQPEHVKTGGSRELPRGLPSYRDAV